MDPSAEDASDKGASVTDDSATHASVMNVELRQLRCLVAIVDEGTFTDAAIALGVSQAAVSRTLASLERVLGVRLLRRTSREVAPTATGLRVLAHARRVLGDVADLVQEATSGRASLRIGYAWSALGRHTLAFQRDWARAHPETELRLVRVNSATAGLAEEPATRPWCADPWTTGASTPRSWGWNGGCAPWPRTIRWPDAARCDSPTSAGASC